MSKDGDGAKRTWGDREGQGEPEIMLVGSRIELDSSPVGLGGLPTGLVWRKMGLGGPISITGLGGPKVELTGTQKLLQ